MNVRAHFRTHFLASLGILLLACTSKAEPMNTPIEQAVIIHFYHYGSTDLTRLFALEDRLETAISAAHAGEYDGNEIATDGSDGFLYMYGPDADRLFDVIRPILEAEPFTRGADVVKRYGAPGDGVHEAKLKIKS